MAERERIRVGNGVSVYREYETWSVEVSWRAMRKRWSLKTRSKGEAHMKAEHILEELHSRVATIERDHLIAITPPEFRAGVRDASFCPPYMVSSPEIERLRTQALEAVRIEDIIRRTNGEKQPPVPPPVEAEWAVTEYGTYLTGHLGNGERHVKVVLSWIRSYIDFAAVKTLGEINRGSIERFSAECATKGNSGDTRNRKLLHLKAFLDWAKGRGYVATNVAEGIKKCKITPVENDCYSRTQLEEIFLKIRGHKIEKVVLTAFWAGMDRMDLEVLDAKHINLRTRRITGSRHKTGKHREEGVPIFDGIWEVVKSFPRKGRVFSEWKNLGSVGKQANAMGIDFRKLRRSFVSHLRLQPVEHDVVARWATHTMAIAAKRYVCPAGEPMVFTFCGERIPRHGHLTVPKALLKKVDD